MELRNLASFLRVAELGNFTRAAQELGYAQSTVSMQIKQLEEEIGYPLFERIGKQNVLTPNGQQLVRYANQIVQIEEQIKNLGSASVEQIKGTIRIGIVESIMNSLLANIIRHYCQRFPLVSIQIVPAVTALLFDLLRHNEVDVIFTMGEKTAVRDCICAGSHPEQSVFLASPGHPLAARESIPLEEIFDHPLIPTGDTTFLHQELTRLAHECGKSVRFTLQTDSAQMIVNLARQGLGVAFLPEYLLQSPSVRGCLVVLPVRDFSMRFYVQVFYHQSKWVTPQMLGLVSHVEEYWAAVDSGRVGEKAVHTVP